MKLIIHEHGRGLLACADAFDLAERELAVASDLAKADAQLICEIIRQHIGP